MDKEVQDIIHIINKASIQAKNETALEPEPETENGLNWPVQCTLGPGLEGAIACETKVGYVNGSKGCLIYRGYDIFDLCANSTYEEVAYLLLNGELPSEFQLNNFKKKLTEYKNIAETQRLLMSFPLEDMSTMAGLRFGVGLLRQKQTYRDKKSVYSIIPPPLPSDDDSYAMESDFTEKMLQHMNSSGSHTAN